MYISFPYRSSFCIVVPVLIFPISMSSSRAMVGGIRGVLDAQLDGRLRWISTETERKTRCTNWSHLLRHGQILPCGLVGWFIPVNSFVAVGLHFARLPLAASPPPGSRPRRNKCVRKVQLTALSLSTLQPRLQFYPFLPTLEMYSWMFLRTWM